MDSRIKYHLFQFKNNPYKKLIYSLILYSLLLTVFLIYHFAFFKHISGDDYDDFISVKESQQKYPLLAKRITVIEPNDAIINFLPLREKLREIARPYGDTFAVYFEYLPTGVSIGINQNTEFYSASLAKVPVVMAYFREQEQQGKNRNNEKITIKSEYVNKNFGTLWTKEGSEITLGEAAQLALIESDNTAANIIADNVSKQSFMDVYERLDIDFKTQKDQILITTKGFSSILKALYFSAVLSKDHSEEILSLMTQAKFIEKLRASIPQKIAIAAKSGIYGEKLFSDCGIVYVPKRQYLLCMISQSDEQETKQRMINVSDEIYNYVIGVNK